MTALADHDEPNWHDVETVPATRFLRAISTVEGRIPRILGPEARLSNEMATWALEPARKANAHELARLLGVDTWCYLWRDGRKAKTLNTKLLLKAWLVDGLGVPKAGRWCPPVPLVDAGGDDRDACTSETARTKVDD